MLRIWGQVFSAFMLIFCTAGAVVLSTRLLEERATLFSGGDGLSDASAIESLLISNSALKEEMERLDRQLQAMESGEGAERLEEMASRLNALRLVNGSVVAVGPGLIIEVSGQLSAATVRDLVNELKSAGAEALAINGRRIDLWSAIYEGSGGAILDGDALGNYVTIEAIGDIAVMRHVLDRRGGLIALLRSGGVSVVIAEANGVAELTLPLVPTQKDFRFAAGSSIP